MIGLTSTLLGVLLIFFWINRRNNQSRLKTRLKRDLEKRQELLQEKWKIFSGQLEKLQKILRLEKDKKMLAYTRESARKAFEAEWDILDGFSLLSKVSEKLLNLLAERPASIFNSYLLDVLQRVVEYQSAVIEAPGFIMNLEREIDEDIRQVRRDAQTHSTLMDVIKNLDDYSMELFKARQLMNSTGDYEEAIKIAKEVKNRVEFIMSVVKDWTKIMPPDQPKENHPPTDEERRARILEVIERK